MEFLFSINYLAVAAASAVSFVIGFVWYSFLFGATWVEELKKHNVTIQQPTQGEMLTKMGSSLCINIVIALAMACLVSFTGSASIVSGLILGIIAACGFAGTALASVFLWESRSFKLFLIDFGYSAACILSSAILLSIWH